MDNVGRRYLFTVIQEDVEGRKGKDDGGMRHAETRMR